MEIFKKSTISNSIKLFNTQLKFYCRDSSLKRAMCKVCQSPLIPGKTAKVRLMGKREKVIKTVCCTCKKAKRIPTKRNYKLWSEQPEALVETFRYSLKSKKNVADRNSSANDKVKMDVDSVKKDNGVTDSHNKNNNGVTAT